MSERPFQRRLIQAAVASCFATAVHANPTGPSVVSGAATFNAVGKNLTVTNTPSAIINWQGFSIRPGEVTRFVQSGAASAVLNRVTGPEHSQLLGQLLSNGRVFLINPNGVTVGAGALIDTAGFVASSLNLSNEDFLAGKFRFTDPGNAGNVVNAGTINAHSGGTVYLVAPAVENHGVITAPGGDIMLAAGKSVELVSTASPHLRVQVQAGGEALNVGQLVAESGRVGLYGAAIRNGGAVSADSAQLSAAGTVVLKASRDVTLDATSTITASGAQGGSITVQAESGTLLVEGKVEAKGGQSTGGEVKLLGEQVGLLNQAKVDASGSAGGGSVNVGGSRQGMGPLPNADAVHVAPGARIDASATDAGDGGTIIVYADRHAGVYGSLAARGGPRSGNGGFIETSGKQSLEVIATPDVTAPAGRGGEWLIDPFDVQIVTAAGTCASMTGCVAGPNWTSNAVGAQLGANLINTALDTGGSVTVTTGAGVAGAGNITFQAGANLAKTAGAVDATLTLSAHNNIDTTGATISSANVTTVGRLNVDLVANSDGAGGGNVIVGGNVTTRGGTFSASGVDISGAGQIVTTGVQGRTGGNVTLNATGTVNYTGAISANAGAAAAASAGLAGGTVGITGGTVTVAAINAQGGAGAAGGFAGGSGGAVTLTKTGGATAVTLNGLISAIGGNATVSATGGSGGTVTVDAGSGSVATTAANLPTLINASGGTGQNGGSVNISAAGNINIAPLGNKAILTSGGTAAANTAGRNAGNITIGSTGGTVTTQVLTAAGSAGLGAANNAGGSGGTIAVSGVGVTLNAAVSAAGGASVNSGGGGTGGVVNLTGTTGTVSSVAAGTIGVAGGRGQDGGTVNVSTGAAGTVNLAGPITASGGTAETGSAGQNGGAVTVTGGSVTLAAVTSQGTAAVGANLAGGSGGTVNVGAIGAAGTINLNGAVSTLGGNANAQGNGGTGGNVTVTDAGTGAVTIAQAIDTRGGTGQNGGNVSVTGGGNVNFSAAAATINTSGGAASANGVAPGAGLGRSAGTVTINSSGAASTVTLRGITATGTAAVAASNKAGGSGGNVSVQGNSVTLNAAVNAAGANANGTGAGGSGGTVGIIGGTGTVSSIAAGTITTSGGTGQNAGNVSIGTLPTGTINLAGAITANGGAGQTGAAGLAGGTVGITGGTVTVAAINAQGGAGAAGGFAGGSGGAVTLTKTGGATAVTLNGLISAIGGNATVSATGGSGGTVTVDAGSGSVATTAANLPTLINASGGTGQNGGSVNISAAGNINIAPLGNKAILTSGGTAAANTAGRNAGNITIGSTGGTVTTQVLTAAGSAGLGAANNAGGSGGTIAVSGVGVTLNAAVSAAGGASVNSGGGGTGGVVNLTGTTGTVSSVAAGTIGVAGGRGQDGGTVNVSTGAAGTVNLAGPITASGGTAETGSAGQNGGAVTVTGGSVTLAAVTSQGTAAVGANLAGGSGGTVNVGAIGAAGTINLNGAVSTLGGNANAQGNGGTGGNVTVTDAGTGAVTIAQAIDARGGTGQNGGNVSVTGGGNVNFSAAAATINTSGGAASANGVAPGAGLGRNAGGVVIQGGDVTAGAITANGSNAAAGSNKNGGNGGNLLLDATDGTPLVTLIGNISANGGNGNGTGTGGSGSLINIQDPTLLNANTTVNAIQGTGGAAVGGTVTFANTLDSTGGARTLAVNTGNGTVAFNGAVGGTAPLASVTTSAGGTAQINGGAVRTTLAQTYGGAVALGADATLTSTTNGNIAFAGTVNSANATARALAVDTGGTTTFSGVVGGTNALSNLTARGGAGITVNGAINVTGGGSSIVLAGATFTNNAGAGALNPGAGRWLVYSNDPATNTFNALASGNQALWNRAYPALVPETGNRYVFTTQPTLTFTSTNLPKTYGDDATAAVAGAYTVSGFVNAATYGNVFTQDTIGNTVNGAPAVTSTGSPATANVGNYPINVSVAGVTSPTGYAIAASSAGQLAVGQRPVTVQANDQSRPYGDPNPTTGPYTLVAGTLVNGDTIGSVNVTSPAVATSPAGSVWVLTNTGANFTTGLAANYTITLQNGQLTIDPRAITVQANNQARPYGDPNPLTGPYTITAGSLAGADSITNVNVTSPATVLSGVGPYALTPTAANFGSGSAANYTITFANGVLTVTPRPITATANNQTKVYGQPDPTLTFTASTVNGDVLAGAPVRAPGEMVAGSPYAITQGTVTNANNPNYSITFVNGQLVITAANLTITADNKTRAYGDANPPLTATFTGLTNGDTAAAIPGVTLTTPAVPASNVANYTLNVTSGANTNYTITYVNGQLAITPAPLQIVADDKAKAFGAPNPPFTATATGFKVGQTVTDLNGTLVFITPATTTSPPGVYSIAPGGVSSGNYTITFVDGVLVVGQGAPPSDQALITALERSESDPTGGVREGAGGPRVIECLTVDRPGARRVLSRCY